MSYAVKEAFLTLQGEGANAGRVALFCRFAGCNLWSGREQDRAAAICRFCDTDFVGTDGINGGRFQDAEALVAHLVRLWGDLPKHQRFVVCTGGEPLLQLDEALIDALHAADFYIAVESNGTIVAPPDIDWLCVSPKAGSTIVQREGNELKLVYPQEGLDPTQVVDWRFDHFYLQPMDGPVRDRNTAEAVAYCLAHPRWRLSLQTHKLIGIP
ncbi:MAG TPA: 7-carboxy-7-deazaguanine synthase [Burkholderiales bacterium]|nr:7-carboxy-7-deazaguanine synthase [Burkholderiales bacterium]